MNLKEHYQQAVVAGSLVEDKHQLQALSCLQEIIDSVDAPKKSWLPWRKIAKQKGAYLCGTVGVGKTFLMDLFYTALKCEKKKRFHFHEFMQQIDNQLRQAQGEQNPLKLIAKNLAKSTSILCFDEFMVEDVAYAMILAEFLHTLFAEGVILVVTSNTEPDNLYAKGIHRERFLPAIAALKENCRLIQFMSEHDYRLDGELAKNRYFSPLSEDSLMQMQTYFENLTASMTITKNSPLVVQKREVHTLFYTQGIVWFDFKTICNLPRSQLDYLELANRFDTIFISNIPILGENDTVFALLFILFIDVMYDRGVRLILEAEVPIELLYVKGEVLDDFKRTTSRLQEMQSTNYLARHPRRSKHAF